MSLTLKVIRVDGEEMHESYLLRAGGWTEERYFEEAPETRIVEFEDGDIIVTTACKSIGPWMRKSRCFTGIFSLAGLMSPIVSRDIVRDESRVRFSLASGLRRVGFGASRYRWS